MAAIATSGVIAVAAALISAVVPRPEWINAFQTMWIRANQVASAEFVVRDIYDQRIQLFLLAFVQMFGDGAWVVLLLNVLCIFVVLALRGRWARRVGGSSGAALFCVAFAAAPEVLLAIGIPTHDIWALPFVLSIRRRRTERIRAAQHLPVLSCGHL